MACTFFLFTFTPGSRTPTTRDRGLDPRAVFYIYRYYTSIWVFLILFGVVLVCGMRKWYAKLDSCSGQPLEPHRKREARLTGFAQMAHRLALRYSSS